MRHPYRMNGLSDSLSIGILITLVFGALFFYLYSRQLQTEKRVGLIEAMLMDLKLSAENLWSNITAPPPSQFSGGLSGVDTDDADAAVEHVQPVSEPVPLESDDFNAADEEQSLFKEMFSKPAAAAVVLGSDEEEEQKLVKLLASTATPSARQDTTKVQANYSSMSLKELKQLAKQRSISLSHGVGKREIIDLLQKSDTSATVAPTAPVAGSPLGIGEGAAELDADFEGL